MILTLRIVATVTILVGWIVLNSLGYMGATIAIKTSMRLSEGEMQSLMQQADRSYWIVLATTGCVAAAMIAAIWWRWFAQISN